MSDAPDWKKYIADGYTITREVAALGTRPAFTFTFRPPPPEIEEGYFIASRAAKTGAEAVAAEWALVKESFRSWNLRDGDNPAVLDEALYRRLRGRMRSALLDAAINGVEQEAELGNSPASTGSPSPGPSGEGPAATASSGSTAKTASP